MKLAYTVATPDTADPTMLALRGELAASFQLLARLGYQGAELMVRNPAGLDPAVIQAQAAEQGLEIPAVSTGQMRKEDGMQLCDLDTAARSRAVCRTREAIDFTAALGARQVNLGTLRGTLPTGADRAEALAAARASLSELLDYAHERNVGIALEPQNRFTVNWLNSVGEALTWMQDFPQPNLSLLFDAARRHGVGHSQRLTGLRFRLADEAAHQRANVQRQRRTSRLGPEGLTEGASPALWGSAPQARAPPANASESVIVGLQVS